MDVEDTADGFTQKALLLQHSDEVWLERSRSGLEHARWTFSAAAEMATLRVALGVERAPPQLPEVDDLVSAEGRMIELAQEGLRRASDSAQPDGRQDLSCKLASEFDQQGEVPLLLLQNLSVGEQIEFQACALETASRIRYSVNAPLSQRAEQLLSCPLTDETQSRVSMEVQMLHRTLRAAGYMRLKSAPSPEPADARGTVNHETANWPRPYACALRPQAEMDLTARLKRKKGPTKLVNAKRGLEYRPVPKVGSTMMRHLLPCLQPGEWREERQGSPDERQAFSPAKILVLQRDPISRFAAALEEVMARVFLQRCPEGPCNRERDGFDQEEVEESMEPTRWYPVAKRLYRSQTFQEASLRELVRAAALDFSCNAKFYASEHFASQASLQQQGAVPPGTQVLMWDLEDLGVSLEEVLESDLVKTVLGDDRRLVDSQALQSCLGEEQAVNTMRVLKRNFARGGRNRACRLHAQRSAADAAAKKHDSFAHLSLKGGLARNRVCMSDTNITNHHDSSLLPSTDELITAVERDQPTLTLLNAAYGQDLLCQSAQHQSAGIG